VSVPANARAVVYVPAARAADVTESGQAARRAPGIRYIGMSGGYVVFEVGGGAYAFASNGVAAQTRGAH